MNDIFVDLEIDKEPYVKKITNHKIINLTGQSGSGKSYYASSYKDNDDYIVVDTDEIFKRYENSTGINKELGRMFREKYEKIPEIGDDFDLIYLDILDYLKDCDKTIIIDSALFHTMKNIYNLRGTVMVMRTSINTGYKRCIERYQKNHPDATLEQLEEYKENKKKMFKWYKYLNEFIEKVDSNF